MGQALLMYHGGSEMTLYVFPCAMCQSVICVFCVADYSDVPKAQRLHVYSTCLVERNRLLPHLWSPHAEDVEVGTKNIEG
jgi:hypothetical protein